MVLKIEFFNEDIINCCKAISECADDLELMICGRHSASDDRCLIDRNLIKMTLATQKITEIAIYLPSFSELIGTPRGFIASKNPKMVLLDRENPDWDFAPWLLEKTNGLKGWIDALVEDLEKKPIELGARNAPGGTPQEILEQIFSMDVAGIRKYNNALLEMFSSGRLSIADVKIEEDERSK